MLFNVQARCDTTMVIRSCLAAGRQPAQPAVPAALTAASRMKAETVRARQFDHAACTENAAALKVSRSRISWTKLRVDRQVCVTLAAKRSSLRRLSHPGEITSVDSPRHLPFSQGCRAGRRRSARAGAAGCGSSRPGRDRRTLPVRRRPPPAEPAWAAGKSHRVDRWPARRMNSPAWPVATIVLALVPRSAANTPRRQAPFEVLHEHRRPLGQLADQCPVHRLGGGIPTQQGDVGVVSAPCLPRPVRD